MKKVHIYIDETYNLKDKNQFYAFAGFICNHTDKMRTEYKKILRKCKAIKKEIKSNDKESIKIRNRIFKDKYLNENLEFIGISQIKDSSMNFKYFSNNVFEQEVIFYKELLKILLLEVMSLYIEEINISIQVEVDKIDKIKREFYIKLSEELKEQFNIKWLDIEMVDSKLSLGLQLADQITGVYREYLKESTYFDFMETFKVLIGNPLSKN